ncbi:MAG: MBOAT family protein [Alphaproteobacteria bacterium]|nr:MBOAT family protein [Alphaproteobacteria bacterium]MDP6518082.1 MBOAT family protein [Alphaproteobacteria bacterium]
MLFNSYEFIFVLLPISVFFFYFLGNRIGGTAPIFWVVCCSLFFYGWWNPSYLLLILVSIVFNFLVGTTLSRQARHGQASRGLVTFGVVANLATIGYFKYAMFFVDNVNTLTGSEYNIGNIILPLAISFFTFQQITFLVDSYKGEAEEYNFVQYCVFVSFFPQLIAGPIVHHSEMMPQFHRPDLYRLDWRNIALGLAIFSIGLFKKAVLADGIAAHGTSVFAAAAEGETLDFLTAWGGALSYTFQLYFDFSGYSDMAVGGARMFGIRLPLNFNSPYKATNIVDFWRRWHMTLSRFLRDYVYIPLGGNRHGAARRHGNLLFTMLVGGLWHGAGWTFVIWGGLHGLYLIVNHLWHALRRRLNGGAPPEPSWLGQRAGQTLTFLAVIVGWVFFRATTLDGAVRMIEGMAGLNGVSVPVAAIYVLGPLGPWLREAGLGFVPGGGAEFAATWVWIVVLLVVALTAPNSQQLVGLDERARPSARLLWRPALPWAVGTAAVLAGGILALPQVSEFLYFQF